MSTTCCPSDSYPRRDPGPHTPKGQFKVVDGVEMYITGSTKNNAGILINPEIYGIRCGDLIELADWLGDKGFYVILPDVHKGDFFAAPPPDREKFVAWLHKHKWETLEPIFDKVVLPQFQEAKVAQVGAIGFCHGAWVNYHLAAKGKLNAVMNFHPSHTNISNIQGENFNEILKAVRCPVLQCPAGNDPDANQPGGSDEKILKEGVVGGAANVVIKPFPEMKHGWASRGDRNDAKVREQQNQAWQLALEFARAKLVSSTCCPPGALPKRAMGPHTPKGEFKNINGYEVYVSGNASSGVGILVSPEVFGIRQGDLVEFADWLADAGYFVVLPEVFKGDYLRVWPDDINDFIAWLRKHPWLELRGVYDQIVFPIFASAGVKKIGGVGFCHGSWVNVHLASEGKLHAIVNLHPSHTNITKFQGENAEALLKEIRCPVLQCPAGQDPADNQPGGSDEKILKASAGEGNVIIKPFPEMQHGWASRGDRNDAKVCEQQTAAWKLALEFFNARLRSAGGCCCSGKSA